jgi:hypothetical protein
MAKKTKPKDPKLETFGMELPKKPKTTTKPKSQSK